MRVQRLATLALPLLLVAGLLGLGIWQNSQRGKVRCAVPESDAALAPYLVAIREITANPEILGQTDQRRAVIEAAPGATLPAGLLFHLRCNLLEWEWGLAGADRGNAAWRLMLDRTLPAPGQEPTVIVPLVVRPASGQDPRSWQIVVANQRGWQVVSVLPQ